MSPRVLIAPVLAALLAGPAAAQEVKKVRRAIVIGEDGKIVEMQGDGDGEEMTWVHAGPDDGDHRVEFFGLHEGLAGSGYLGVEMTELTDALRDHFGVPRGEGVMVAAVEDGSPAAVAGIQVADIVTAVNGEPVTGRRDLGRLIRELEEGEVADIELWRDGRLEQVTAQVAARERNVFKIRENGTVRIEVLGDTDSDVDVLYRDLGGNAFETVRDYLGSGEWVTRIEDIEDLDFDALQARMKEVERQLIEIEIRLREIDSEDPEDP